MSSSEDATAICVLEGRVEELEAEVERLNGVLRVVADGWGFQDHLPQWEAAQRALESWMKS